MRQTRIEMAVVIFLVISYFKPNILLSKKVREKVDEKQKEILVKNRREIYFLLVVTFEFVTDTVVAPWWFNLFTISFCIVMWILTIPQIKENRKIIKEAKQ